GSQDGVDFMVMECVSGQTMDQVVPPGGLAADVAIRYALQAADALAYAHAAGIVHRDLKPSNVRVDKNGMVKVLDFGLAKAVAAETDLATIATITTKPGTIVGTAAYMSPEQAEGKVGDARSDIFSFGALLYEMLSGRRAFEGKSSAALLAAVLRDEPKPLSELKREVPPELRQIVSRCLKKNPAARYASGTELARDLKSCRDLLFPESGTMLSPARIVREVQRPRVLVPLVLLAVLLGAGAAWLVKHERDARWARETAVPEISQLYDQGKFGAAYALAVKAEKSIPGDRAIKKRGPGIPYQMSLKTPAPGGVFSRREYNDSNAVWEYVGKTPFKD